jgi:hypothetical protein
MDKLSALALLDQKQGDKEAYYMDEECHGRKRIKKVITTRHSPGRQRTDKKRIMKAENFHCSVQVKVFNEADESMSRM